MSGPTKKWLIKPTGTVKITKTILVTKDPQLSFIEAWLDTDFENEREINLFKVNFLGSDQSLLGVDHASNQSGYLDQEGNKAGKSDQIPRTLEDKSFQKPEKYFLGSRFQNWGIFFVLIRSVFLERKILS